MSNAISLEAVAIEKPDDVNVVVGQAHFIKTIDDLHETLVGVSPQAKFGVAFCEASGVRLIRRSGDDEQLVSLAVGAAQAVAAGHSFVEMLRDAYPVNILNAIKMVPEVCTIFCATANPMSILVAGVEPGRGVVGVIDGAPPLGVEQAGDVDKGGRCCGIWGTTSDHGSSEGYMAPPPRYIVQVPVNVLFGQ